MLDALGKSRIRYVSTRHEQVAAHAADGYARATGQAGRAADPSRAGPDQRRDRRRQRRARFDPDGRDRRRRAVVLPRPPPAPGSQPAPGRRPVPDLPAVLQARLSRRQRARSAAHHRARVPPGADRTARSGAGRRADGRLLHRACRSTRSARCRRRSRGRRSTPATAERIVAALADRGTPGALRRRRRAVGARVRRARRRSPKRSSCRSRTR